MRKIKLIMKGVLCGTLIVVYLCSCGKNTAYYLDETEQISEKTDDEQCSTEDLSTLDSEVKYIYVYVCGQIQNSGVYTLPEGSRICDVFELAGGLTEGAATDYWNQAKLLQDGDMIYVPTIEEAKDRYLDGDTTSHVKTDDGNKVNINTASKEELMTIPGIGEAKALAILAYRQQNGPFSTVEDLKKVEGIKDGVFSKMKAYIEI
jgi:competence protein ComEA